MWKAFVELAPVLQGAIVLSTAILTAIFLFVIFTRGLSVKSKLGNLTIGDSKKEDPTSPHATCEHRHDAIDLLETVFKNSDERRYMKDIDAIKRQMEIAEDYVKQVIALMTRVYLHTLSAKGHADPASSPGFTSYSKNVLPIVECQVVSKIRTFVRENHFAEKTEREFEEYIEARSKQLREFVSHMLNDIYLYRDDITRSELYEANEKRMPEFKEYIRNFLLDCREIAVEVNQLVNTLNEEDKRIMSMFK